MPFELHVFTKAAELPVTISLRPRKAGVTCYVSVRFDLIKSIGGNEKSGFDVLIGTGDDAGKMRIRVSKDGKSHPRRMRDTVIFNLGRVPSFPDQEMDKQKCEAKPIESNTIEIALPAWDVVEHNDAPEKRPVPQKTTASALHTNGVRNGNPVVTRNGITIDLTADEESISFGKKTMDISTRQAAVAAALLRAMPQNVGREWLIKNAMADVPAHTRDVALDMVFKDLGSAMAGVGLELKVSKGVGAMIAIAGAK